VDSPSEFLVYFEKIRGRTERVALLIPEDRIDWTPAPGKFTLGDTVRHIAGIERWMFAENAMRRPSRYAGCGRELADGKEAVIRYLRDRHRESVEIFGRLSPGDFEARCETPGGASIRIGKWLRSMIEHEIHHRGQIYLMLGMLGVATPPLYGLTSEEVRARSLADDLLA
jgi:uncharacterized damage-inducible protein DinB